MSPLSGAYSCRRGSQPLHDLSARNADLLAGGQVLEDDSVGLKFAVADDETREQGMTSRPMRVDEMLAPGGM